MEKYISEITGNLDIFIVQKEDDWDGKIIKSQEVLIHGDAEGLKSFATLLIKLADANQNDIIGLPIGAREHVHLRPKHDLSNSSEQVIVGRLDAKGTSRVSSRIDRQCNPQVPFRLKTMYFTEGCSRGGR